MPSKKRPETFANTLAELEVLANRLEDNDTPLEQSLKDFENGVQLIRQAQKALQEAEQKVQMLLDQKGEPVAAPLEGTGLADDGEGGAVTPSLQAFMQWAVNSSEQAMARLGGTTATTGQQAANPLGIPIDYALGAGGKRIRPCLVYAAGHAVAGTTSLAATLDHLACAIEMIHTYSLIHDDLPAMDDDDLRRGKPTLHKAFDEATAILVGDGLQARAFELIAVAPNLSENKKINIIRMLANSSGFSGMVGGQYIDISSTGRELSLEQLRAMHGLKTGALIRAAVAMGGIAAGATEGQLQALDSYAGHAGLAFQVVDDILDVEGNTATLGKTGGKDGETDKATYVKLMGLDGARAEAQGFLDAALAALDEFDQRADHLRDIARFIVERDR